MRRAAAALVLLVACSDTASRAVPSTTATTTASTTLATTTTTTTPAPPPATDPRGVLRAVVDAERTIATAVPSSRELATAAKAQQLGYRTLSAHPEWDAVWRREAPPELVAVIDTNVTAARQLRALTSPRPSLPPWHIVAPAPADELLGDYRDAERQFGVPWAYLAAIHLVETRMGRIRGPSTAGARGPMQFLPSTWAAYGAGGDIESNRDSILAAGRYLRANGAPERMADALWHYNHSSRYVDAVTRYAQRMAADDHAYRAYWHWDVYYRLTGGDVLLPVGYVGA